MATQRAIPIEDIDSAQNINIDSSFMAHPRACIILDSQDVTFTNASGSTVAIQFVLNALNPDLNQQIFSDIPSLPSGPMPSAPQTPDNLTNGNGSVNYYVVVGGASYGPYCIQVGDGPMQVLFTLSGDTITCTPDPVAIPPYNLALQIAGTIAMYPDDANNDYSIQWPGGDPFTPPLSTPDGASHGDSASSVPQDYSYTVTSPNPADGGSGGGTVKIKTS
ncbi:MAG TPA: hypothetical protein VJK27_01090 [Terriglobales bacterium]|jgi:hypothetical protein|nr:hypothetical protein [Terriglobales bacterium]